MIYAAYASIYDMIGEAAFAEGLVGHILGALPEPPARALDLACGTGAATLALAAAGVAAVGVDRSPHMLAIAQAKARDRRLPAHFVEADLRFLPVGNGSESYDQHEAQARHDPADRHAQAEVSSLILHPSSFPLITCLYDSLNYLTGDGELEQAFCGAATLLTPGGRLFFDLNSAGELASWDDVDQVVYDRDGILVYNRLSYDNATRLAHGRIVWFSRLGERWHRDEENHVERAWSDAEVVAALAAAGLSLTARRTPRWEPAAPDAPRVVYEAAKA